MKVKKSSSIIEGLSHIIFITGGTKSGKSEFAEYLAKEIKNLSTVQGVFENYSTNTREMCFYS